MSEGQTVRIIGQRDAFFDALYPIFESDKNCIIITADNGAPSLDKFRDLPGQYYQVGIAEQAMITIATGLACEGKKVWTYCIAPFATTRIHEFVKLDACAMNLPITLLGVGAGIAYSDMGPSHHTLEDISIMRALPGLEIYSPADSVCAAALAQVSYERPGPKYIRFDRAGVPNIYEGSDGHYWGDGFNTLAAGISPIIIATGIMVSQALKVRAQLGPITGDFPVVIDLFRPNLFSARLLSMAEQNEPIVTLEEHFLPGGLGSIVSEALHDAGMTNRLLRIGMPFNYVFDYGGRELLWQKAGMDVDSIVRRIKEWL